MAAFNVFTGAQVRKRASNSLASENNIGSCLVVVIITSLKRAAAY
jgi:hypothetical protein